MGEQRYRVPDQPDGIDDDSRDVPDPIRAARRIRAYVTGAGDGLYDVVNPGDGPRPLYAVRSGAPGPVNEVVDGLPYPCQPIGCDAGRHLAGCVYASADCGDAWHSAPGETAPPDSCPTCGGGHG